MLQKKMLKIHSRNHLLKKIIKIQLPKKNNLKLEIKANESNEKTEERIDLSNLYSLLETGFNQMSSSIENLSTSITSLTKEMKDNNTKFTKVLQILNDNLLKIMDSNNIKYSTDSQENIKKILDEMKKANSPNKKEDNRSVDNKKLSKNNTSNSKLDDSFHRLYNNSNRRIKRKLRTLKISKNIIGNKSQEILLKVQIIQIHLKFQVKRIRNRPSYTNKNFK